MIIDINSIKRQGLDRQTFTFSFEIDKELILDPSYIFTNAKVDGEVVLDGRKVIVKGQISYDASGQCARCVEDAVNHISCPFSEVFSERPEEDEYRYKSGLVDLTELVKDNVLYSQPSIILCSEDCLGLCPQCGTNLNKEKCNCENK